MQKIRIINLSGGDDIVRVLDDNGLPTNEPFTEAPLQEFECPDCHNLTYGRFEPFVNRGIEAWCSTCGKTKYTEAALKAFAESRSATPVKEE